MDNLFSLKGKVSVVTGAGRGLGKAMAVGLAKAGSDVIATDIIETGETVDEIKKLKRKALGITVDVADEEDVKRMAASVIEKFGRLDVLVNNAGIFIDGPAEDMRAEDWDKVVSVNLRGQFLSAKAAGKQMIKQGAGKIINIASVAGILAFGESAPYNTSKAGVIMLTKSLAVDWGKHNIQVNAICPGIFATAMTEDFIKDKGFMRMVNERVPLGRYAEPEELAGAAVFLASKASDYMTGHALVIDGGWTVGL